MGTNIKGESRKDAATVQTSRGSFIQQTETICQLMSQFMKHFTTVHMERKYLGDQGEVAICVTCHSAMETLKEIRKGIRGNPHCLELVFKDEEFLKLLVKLCMLDSPGLPRICSATCARTRAFYEAGEYRSLNAIVSVHEDGAGRKMWEDILGNAVGAIRLPTYIINIHGSHYLPGRRSCMWPTAVATRHTSDAEAPRDTGKTQPKLPESNLRDWSVVRCIDAQHLLVYRSENCSGREGANSLSRMLADCHRDSTPRGDRPKVGEVLGLLTSADCLLRVLVVGIINLRAVVWAVDEGSFLKIPWCNLVDLLPSFRCLPPSIGLGVITGVKAAPFLGLLRECIETFHALTDLCDKNVSLHDAKIKRLKSLGMIEALSDLLDCSDCLTRMASATCLTRLCKLKRGAEAVSEANCIPKVRGRLRRLVEQQQRDPSSLRTEGALLVQLLDAAFSSNERLCHQHADTGDVALLTKMQKCPLKGNNFSQAVESCLNTLRSLRDELRRPFSMNLVALRPEQLNMPECVQNPPRMMQQFYGLRAVPTCADPQSAGSQRTSSAPPSQGSVQAPSRRCYYRRTIVPFRSDSTHELRPISDMTQESERTLNQIICSFLNSWQPCTVFYGITTDGFVQGLRLNFKQRDALRLGIDHATRKLEPCLTADCLTLNFVPVLSTDLDKCEPPSHFVLEISMRGVDRIVYSLEGICYLRDGGQSYTAKAYDLRAWISQLEETYVSQAEGPLPIETGQLP